MVKFWAIVREVRVDWVMKVWMSSSGSGLSPDPGGDPHPLDLQASLLQDLQAPRDVQAHREGKSGVGPHGPDGPDVPDVADVADVADLHPPPVLQEKEELIEEWQPEPLVAPLTSKHQPSVKYDVVTG